MASIDSADLFSAKDLVVVVTGGGTGIGLFITQALEANGATVYIIGRRKEVLEKAASTSKHGNIRIIQGDVTSKADLSRAVSLIQSEVGFVNVVVANSGISGPTTRDIPKDADISTFRKHLFESDADHFNETFAVNTSAVFYTATAFLELLDAGNKKGNLKQKSQIVAISSIGAFNRVPLAGYAYGASKAGVVHMIKQFATGFVKYDIRANVIAPGFYPSEMTQGPLEQQSKAGWPKELIPDQRPGDGEDLAGAILFLVSRAGAYVNGNVLVSDGGRLSVVPASY